MENRRKEKNTYKTSTNERLRKSKQYKKWRESIFKRDNYECQNCQSKKRLHPHHIKSFAHFPILRFKTQNGTTLCYKCHGKIHNINFNGYFSEVIESS